MISLKLVNFSDKQDAIQSVRLAVFTDEQGVDPDLDLDGNDESAIQVLALSHDKPVGTGRMLADGHIGRIAVLPEFRGKQLGSRIVTLLIKHAREAGLEKVSLGAQVNAVPFYTKLGFSAYGENYLEANILHTPMQLFLNQQDS